MDFPRVQRAMPKPFARPAINLGPGDALEGKRDWRMIPVTHVRAGDIVADVGLITDVGFTWSMETGSFVVLTGHAADYRSSATTKTCPITESVWAFAPNRADAAGE